MKLEITKTSDCLVYNVYGYFSLPNYILRKLKKISKKYGNGNDKKFIININPKDAFLEIYDHYRE